jgi:hypothetical protein
VSILGVGYNPNTGFSNKLSSAKNASPSHFARTLLSRDFKQEIEGLDVSALTRDSLSPLMSRITDPSVGFKPLEKFDMLNALLTKVGKSSLDNGAKDLLTTAITDLKDEISVAKISPGNKNYSLTTLESHLNNLAD